MTVAEGEPSGPHWFHSKDGWFFQRTPAGEVIISYYDQTLPKRPLVSQIKLEPELWASCVASVSKAGETTETYEQAVKFHQGEG